MVGLAVGLVVLGYAIFDDPTAGNGGDDLPLMDVAAFNEVLAASPRPAVINVWGSWCLPCRDEAPFFSAAHEQFGTNVDFYGVSYQDNQPGAKRFLEEFDLPFVHYFDFDGELLARYGGIGVPRTYFFAPGGELAEIHQGEIDLETLTAKIEALLD